MDRSSDRARELLRLTIALAALVAPAEAHAFCRTTTVNVPANYEPTEGCFQEGNVLWWRNACVGYSIQEGASRQVTLPEAEQAIATAFTKWTGTACPADDAGESRVSIDVRDEGPVACDEVQYNESEPNQHVIIFRDDVWPYSDSSNTLALTTVTFDPDTGELYDADMEINSTPSIPLTVSGPVPPGGYDFASVVTHETGHFLGMAHSPDSRATMFARYIQGSTSMRDLSEDDVDGICAAYPPDGTRTTSIGSPVPEGSCDPTPRHGFSSLCAPPQAGCVRVARGGSAEGTGTGFALAGVGVIACALAFRRRSSVRSPRA
jgi:Matrixin